MELKLSKYINFSGPLTEDDGLSGKQIIFSTRKSMGVSVTNYVVQLVKNSQFSELPNHLFNVLMFHEMVIPADQEETDEVLKVKGIVGEDASEINPKIIVDLNKWQNSDSNLYLNQIIATSKITSKSKTVSIHLRAPLKDFSLKNYNLNEIKTFFDSNSEMPKLEYQLLCGVPIDETLSNNDLSWLVNIQIICLADGSISDFLKSIGQLRAFTEEVKLKYKPNIRVFFNTNFKDFIDAGNEILNSLNDSILRFSLRKDSFENLEEWQNEELKMLNALNQYEIHCVQFPEAAFKYLEGSIDSESDSHNEHFDDFVMKINTHGLEIKDKNNYNSDVSNSLESKSPICYECMYLSMCGGIINKSEDHNLDCPDHRSNIMVKARMKYKI